jgi:hypothetical protein
MLTPTGIVLEGEVSDYGVMPRCGGAEAGLEHVVFYI